MATLTHPVASSGLFVQDAENRKLFAEHFDQQPFLFRHALHTMDLFQMPALLKLAQKCMDKRQTKSHFETGKPVVDGFFGNKPADLTLVEALQGIGESSNWIILKRIHEEPEYREALESFITEISELSGIDMRRKYHDPILTIFITSPNRITPYHLDGEANFLAQVQGSKTVYVYNANDPYILTEEEKEKYWTGNLLAPRWHEELSDGQWHFDVKPGNGVFNPATFPHWVKNNNNVSVSVSVNFKRVRNDAIGAYRTNYFTRKLGLHPTAPGKSPSVDRIKSVTVGNLYTGLHSTRKALRSKFGV